MRSSSRSALQSDKAKLARRISPMIAAPFNKDAVFATLFRALICHARHGSPQCRNAIDFCVRPSPLATKHQIAERFI
jgi:hypothetical protein